MLRPKARLIAKARSAGKSTLITPDQVEAALTYNQNVAFSSFWGYRQYMHPHMKTGFFQKAIARELQTFYTEMKSGGRPILVIQAPPQHGKSDSVTDFTQWLAGREPGWRQIYASFSDRLGVRANLRMQRAMDMPKWQAVFSTRLNTSNVVTMSGQYLRNREMLEFVGHEGSFRNTTVNGPINGESLDVGVIDDPLKGRREANSKTVRDATWAWLTDDFLTRFSEHAGLIIVLTRWHLDDPVGRLIASNPNVRVVRFPAIAERDEYQVGDKIVASSKALSGGVLVRRKGDPLFPELKSKEFLLTRKAAMTTAGWESVYQQNPIVIGGDLFPVENIVTVPACPAGVRVLSRVRYWDKAGTKGAGAFTAGVRMAHLSDGRFLIEDVVHGQWKAFDREVIIKTTAKNDGRDVKVFVEQEPGSGGKESAERTVANLAGFIVEADRVTGDKETRAEPYAAQVQGGNVLILAAVWNKVFLDEHEFFPNGPYKDQVDAAGGAFAKLTGVGKEAGVLW